MNIKKIVCRLVLGLIFSCNSLLGYAAHITTVNGDLSIDIPVIQEGLDSYFVQLRYEKPYWIVSDFGVIQASPPAAVFDGSKLTLFCAIYDGIAYEMTLSLIKANPMSFAFTKAERADCLAEKIFPSKITFSGFAEYGVFDPSLTLDPVTKRLWMSFSAVETALNNSLAVTTRLAHSIDNGLSWTDSGAVVNDYLDVELSEGTGTWHHEVSRVIYDPGANLNERWKLFWHHYLKVDGERLFEHGWIAYKAASTPAGLVFATEQKLFAGSIYNLENDTEGNAITQSPVGGAPLHLNTFHPELNACLAFSELGAYTTATALYLSLPCFTGNENLIAILKCDHPCDVTDMDSYQYLGIALNNSIAATMASDKFSASEMFEINGRVFLMVTPVTDQPFANAYHGCVIFEFSDLETASLVGGASPVVVDEINGTENNFNGACGYHESAMGSGVIYSEAIVDSTGREFQLFLSGTIVGSSEDASSAP